MKYLKAVSLVFSIVLCLNLVIWSLGYAQDAAAPAEPAWKLILNMFLVSVLPALWAALGPMATAWITTQVNKVNVYVPRPVQVVLSAVIAAVGAGLTGDPTTMVTASMAGATGQVMAATDPETLKTTAPAQ